MPFAIREAIGRELDRLEQSGIIEKFDYAQWAIPMGDNQNYVKPYKCRILSILWPLHLRVVSDIFPLWGYSLYRVVWEKGE